MPGMERNNGKKREIMTHTVILMIGINTGKKRNVITGNGDLLFKRHK